MNDFFDEAMTMIAYGFRHMQLEGASTEDMTDTASAMASAIREFSSTCINNGDTSHSIIEETP
jgi:hypothetical protein